MLLSDMTEVVSDTSLVAIDFYTTGTLHGYTYYRYIHGYSTYMYVFIYMYSYRYRYVIPPDGPSLSVIPLDWSGIHPLQQYNHHHHDNTNTH